MKIVRNGTRKTLKAPPAYFTGDVWQVPVIAADDAPGLQALFVTFAPGARTAWHTHPRGQTLHVTEGCGLFQTAGQPPVTIRPGDTIWIPPGERHWHGAGPDTMMTHLAMQEELNGIYADWQEHVSEEDYSTPPED